jgi:hypothetical protein
MASVNNATGVYSTLGYNFNDPNGYVIPLSSDTQEHLHDMPPVLNSWQAQDMASSDTAGYFVNPVLSDVEIIVNSANSILELANSSVDLTDLLEIANGLFNNASSFLAHTNRLSGITPWTGEDQINPYYEYAMALGKNAMYITNQTDGIINNSPILGSFTSILVGPQIKENANTILIDYNLVNNSITVGTSGSGTEEDPIVTTNTSNLTPTQILQISNDMSNTTSFLVTRQNGDITYFSNLKSLINNYNKVKQFSNMGETQIYLINNFIGTPKLISRINS